MGAENTVHAAQERLAFAPAGGEDALTSVRDGFSVPAPRYAPAHQSRLNSALYMLRAILRPLSPALAAEWERGTGFLLIPVILGAGAATNFSLAREPSVLLLAALAVLSAAGLFLAGQRPAPRLIAAALLIFLVGMLAASFETWRAGTKMLGAEISTRITARVVMVEERAGQRPRITLDLITTERPQLRYSPSRIRVTAREIPPGLMAGQIVGGVVRLLPPTGPVRPDSYDFSFASYFDGIGASGFFLSGPFPVEAEETPPGRLLVGIENARQALASHIRSRIGGSEGAIAAALVAGVRSGIPEEENEVMRVTGLYHIISISGLHMALVAGTVIGLLRHVRAVSGLCLTLSGKEVRCRLGLGCNQPLSADLGR